MLRFLSDHVSVLPLGVVSRLLHTHDVLLSLVPLVENPPWSRRRGGKLEKFSDQRWLPIAPQDAMMMSKLEGQVWLTLYNLLMDKACRKQYQYNTHRKDVLVRVSTNSDHAKESCSVTSMKETFGFGTVLIVRVCARCCAYFSSVVS
jgi:hypothetical protein